VITALSDFDCIHASDSSESLSRLTTPILIPLVCRHNEDTALLGLSISSFALIAGFCTGRAADK
jgi:hypothetical protein